MTASEMASKLSLAERVATVLISRSTMLFRLPDAVLLDVERRLVLVERAAGGGARPSRRVERRCAMKRSRDLV